jgi:hypothetical protein
VIGAPIGDVPRNATAPSASNLPRMSGGLSCWLIALSAAMKAAPPAPSGMLNR